MKGMVKKIDLRVHAGAPSGRDDDERYRRLAMNYTNHIGWTISQSVQSGVDVAIGPHDELDATTTTLAPVASKAGYTAGYDETTYLDDTQLAYNALESQLLTSSLDFREERTPARVSRMLEADSPWPNDLARHSPVAVARDATSDTRSEKHSSPPPRPQPEVVRPASRSTDSGIFKPFKLPIKRKAYLEASRAQSSKQLAGSGKSRFQTPAINGESQSSYLKTPNLVTPMTKQQHRGDESAGLDSLRYQTNGNTLTNENDGFDGYKAEPTTLAMPDYRERTPKQQIFAPYVALREEDRLGLAYVGTAGAVHTVVPTHMPHRSQASGSGQETTSELPTSYSLSDITSESSRARLRNSQRSTSDPGPLGAGDSASHSAGSVKSASQPEYHAMNTVHGFLKVHSEQKDGRQQEGIHQRQSADSLVPAADGSTAKVEQEKDKPSEARAVATVVRRKQSNAVSAETSSSSLDSLPTSILPPEPSTGLAKFDTHITDAFEYLAGPSAVSGCYKPIAVLRDLRAMERGYWLIPLLEWPMDKQLLFWQSLTTFIGDGRAGWGVWCQREPSQSSSKSATLGIIRVYCWGEVVKHIYLMLYVASKSEVRRAGLRWLDAQDTVVVEMRGPASTKVVVQ